MLATLAALTALSFAQQQTDTTLTVERGARLSVNNFGGEVIVRAGPDNRVRIRATHSSRDRVGISAGGSVVRVQSSSNRMGMSRMVEYEITVPAWMAVSISGQYTDISVAGVQADVSAETVEGDVTLEGGNGTIELKSIEGDVRVTGARGRLTVNSVEGEIRLTGITADITAETVDGDIIVESADASVVDVSTLDGDITYLGTIKDGGRYTLSTHDGDVTLAVPERANATFSVATFDGDYESSFPCQVTPGGRRRFSCSVGNGSARVELETFDGSIQLRRPGEVRVPRAGDKNKHDGGHNDSDYQF